MNLDSAALSLEQRFRELAEIIGLFLMDGETVEANLYAQQAMPLQSACEDKATKLQFLVSYARILDSQHKYLEAARRYHSLSLEGSIEEEERLQLLSHAVRSSGFPSAPPIALASPSAASGHLHHFGGVLRPREAHHGPHHKG